MSLIESVSEVTNLSQSNESDPFVFLLWLTFWDSDVSFAHVSHWPEFAE